MQWIDAPTIRRLLDYPSLCAAFAQAHREPLPVIADLCLAHPGSADRFMLRSAWSERQMVGVKLATEFPGNQHRHPASPSIQGVYVAFDGITGAPIFVADGAALTARKTAADSALGLDLLARQDVRTMLMVGAGDMAGPLIEAFTALRPSLRQVFIWNRTRPRAEKLAADLQIPDVELTVVDDLDAALPAAEVICAATMSDQPLIRGAQVAPGTHVNLVGSWLPHMREADNDVLIRGQLYANFRPTALASGELQLPLATGVISVDDIIGDLFDLCGGSPPCFTTDQITVFKNAGGAHLDLFTAQLLARRMGIEQAARRVGNEST